MTKITIEEALTRCIEHREIFYDEMLDLMKMIINGKLSSKLISAILIGLRVKKETIGEISAAAQVIREMSFQVPMPDKDNLLDMCGTGGDSTNTFNISTAAMFVVASSGVKVAKHGNKSASSSSGSADVLEALGVNIHLNSNQVIECMHETNIGFMFAPHYSFAMEKVSAIRKELNVRTIFNILGPLTNPARASNQLMGVFHPDLVGIQARVLKKLGSKHVLVIHGLEGIDEASLGGATMVGELKDNNILEYQIHAEDYGINMSSYKNFIVKNREESSHMILEALKNKKGAIRDIVAFNAGLAIYAGNGASSIKNGIQTAFEMLANGAAFQKLEEFKNYTRKFAK
ncbi:Anthranilate phosphoribosyltransferase [Candidatus Kinetoplastibacterium sorsogonicusi]|uniref:Anthranilate phosphoribosyltransferase n=1 Tax=Candidatus Kinetoplastidibacterium kentomonadis TaxID=1576550 RepID=A0A3S7J937_9PROT|nr:anthranilate phosphoribosyltransferase [Candidatus Kinetoplastibacterium sorsogonicusi]AWD32185.1 Anthranilate phosphoribosyltransferase [Candidatus Kinetoplastibacterium sorsogonicusi]